MINILKIGLSFLFLLGMNTPVIENHKEIKHTITIKHPGISLTETVERTLVQVTRAEKKDEFYMKVKTVVCGDSRCRIDEVKIYWNELGFFKRLEIPKDVQLEKAGGQHFDKVDYQKLHKILSNRQSSLKDVYKEEVVGNETTEGVDGMTGATIILNTNDYVKGAVWTCYTLWHWANSDVYSIIRDITAEDLSNKILLNTLKKEDIDHKIFALEQIIKQKSYSSETVQLILEQTAYDNYQLLKLISVYLENASTEIYYASLLQLLNTKNNKQRQFFLDALQKTNHPASTTFFEEISTQFLIWEDYPSISLLLNIIESKKATTPIINQQVISFLNHKNLLIARRAYWFLEAQTLSSKQQKTIKKFYQRYNEKL